MFRVNVTTEEWDMNLLPQPHWNSFLYFLIQKINLISRAMIVRWYLASLYLNFTVKGKCVTLGPWLGKHLYQSGYLTNHTLFQQFSVFFGSPLPHQLDFSENLWSKCHCSNILIQKKEVSSKGGAQYNGFFVGKTIFYYYFIIECISWSSHGIFLFFWDFLPSVDWPW